MPTIHLPQLERVQIAKPCPARWEDMEGDDVRRLCAHCNLHVTNLSAMSAEQAEAFIAAATERQGERVCIRLFRRADGTVLTRDCPVGVAKARAALVRVCGRAAALIGLSIAAAQSSHAAAQREYFSVRNLRPVQWLASVFGSTTNVPTPCTGIMGEMAMGKMAIAPTTTTPVGTSGQGGQVGQGMPGNGGVK